MEFDLIRDAIAKQLRIAPEKITEDSRLAEDLKADSLDIVELVMDMEQEYDIEIPDEDLVKLRTVGDIYNYLKSR